MSRHALPPYATALVLDVHAKTGYPIQLVPERSLEFDSEVRVARPGQPWHQISSSPEYGQFLTHFLVSGARKILRFYSAPADKRYVPGIVDGRRLPSEDEADLRRRVPIPDHLVAASSAFLLTGLVRQVTSFPIDLRVESELYEELPEHRPLQRAYLDRQVKDIEPHFDREIADVAPSRVYAASSAMNVVLADEAAELAGTPPGPLARTSPHRAMGTRLRQILRDEKAPGHVGDRYVADRWAEELGVRGWYEWVSAGVQSTRHRP